MNILVRASQSVLVYNHKNRQQHALVSEYCITAPIILPILPYQRREITRVKRYYQDVIPRYMPDEFRSHFRYLKTFVRELQIVQHLENQLVQHQILPKLYLFICGIYRLLSLSKFACMNMHFFVCNCIQKKQNSPKIFFYTVQYRFPRTLTG